MTFFHAKDFLTSKDDSDFLGSGSYASVRRCYHKELGRVVVKYFVLSGSKIAIEKQSKNIKNEANVLCRLHHKNIVKMFGSTKWSIYSGVIMEEASGHNLEDLVIYEKEKHISWPLRLQFCVEIAEGLNYLHYHNPKRAYIHGDLKLQNILLSDDLVVKIADFGAVSLLQATGFSAGSLDIVSSKQHTWLYSAPEFLNNPDMQRTRAMDVYSYAMIGYEIITRNQVFSTSGSALPRLILQLIKDNGQKPNTQLIDDVKQSLIDDESNRKICFQLEKTIIKCWQTNPEDRSTIKEVKDKLKTIALTYKPKSNEGECLPKKRPRIYSKTVRLSHFDPSFKPTHRVQAPKISTSSDSSSSDSSASSDSSCSNNSTSSDLSTSESDAST